MTNQYPAIPQELKDLRAWLCFKKEPREGKITKLPKSAHYNADVRTNKGKVMGWNASTSHPKTWDSFSSCVEQVKRARQYNDGIGLVITPPYVGIDLDHVLDSNTKEIIKPQAAEVVRRFMGKAYIEVSPSGDGLHIITKGSKAGLACKNEKLAFEIYQTQWDGKSETTSGGRYLTMTGNALEGSSSELRETQEELDWFCAEFMKNAQTRTQKEKLSTRVSNSALKDFADELSQAQSLSDSQVMKELEKDREFVTGFKEGRQAYAATIGKENESDSEIDESFFLRIAQVTSNLEQIARIARNSAMVRAKWDREDYLCKFSIPKAIELANKKKAEKAAGYTSRSGLKLLTNDKGQILKDLTNIIIVLEQDPRLPKFRRNLLSGVIEFYGSTPWGQGDDEANTWDEFQEACLIRYIKETHHFQAKKDDLNTALLSIAQPASFHPVRDMLRNLPKWDGKERAEALFIDYLGAEDEPYTRVITRYFLSAAYQRAFKAGIKWDNCPILIGGQGIGKSTLLAKLAIEQRFFSDSLRVDMMGKKEGQEILGSTWLVELSELAGMRKAESEAVKQCLSSISDKYRQSYGRFTRDHLRQCVIIGTSNARDGILQDQTGNRRFFPIYCDNYTEKRGWDLTSKDALQIWAEVKAKWADLKLELPKDIQEVALERQEAETFVNPDLGVIEAYLDMPRPDNWDSMDEYSRKSWFSDYLEPAPSTCLDSSRKREIEAAKNNPPAYEVTLQELWACALFRKWEGVRSAREAGKLMGLVHEWEKSGQKTSKNAKYPRQVIYRRRLV